MDWTYRITESEPGTFVGAVLIDRYGNEVAQFYDCRELVKLLETIDALEKEVEALEREAP